MDTPLTNQFTQPREITTPETKSQTITIMNTDLTTILQNLINGITTKSGYPAYTITGHSTLQNTYDASLIKSWCISNSYTTMEELITGIANQDYDLMASAEEEQDLAMDQFLNTFINALSSLSHTKMGNGIHIFTEPDSGYCITLHTSDHGFYITECSALD